MKSLAKATKAILMFTISFSLIFVTSCKKDDVTSTPIPTDPYPIPSTLKLIGTTYAQGASALVKLYAETDLQTGYNKIYVALYDSLTKARITDSHIGFSPLMHMMSMTHACPVENPDENAVKGLFEGAVYFSMPSNSSEYWTLTLHVHNHSNDKEGEAEFDITVKNTPNRIMSLTALNDSSKISISLVKPFKPEVGINDFEIAIHKRANMMSFPGVDNYTVEIEPTMPSMGHGSPNNVNPSFTANGHYAGKVNFTMTGLWRVKFLIKQGTAIVDSTAYFDITL